MDANTPDPKPPEPSSQPPLEFKPLPPPPGWVRVRRALLILTLIVAAMFPLCQRIMQLEQGVLWITPGAGSGVSFTRLTATAERSLRTRAAQLQATTAAAQRTTTALLPMCSATVSGAPSGVIVFAVTVSDPRLGQVLRVYPDGSHLCQMPNTANSAHIVALDTDGRGAVMSYGDFFQHVDFFTRSVEAVSGLYAFLEFIPTLTAPGGDPQAVIRDGALSIMSIRSGSETRIDLPEEVIAVIMAQWIAPATAS
ncbi:MAG: hypothetical protein U0670_07185 [Anaerolineae bacterium]